MEENVYEEMSQKNDNLEYENDLGQARCIAIGFSFLFPIIGIIIYFVQRRNVENPNAYLIAAACGIGLGIILRMAT